MRRRRLLEHLAKRVVARVCMSEQPPSRRQPARCTATARRRGSPPSTPPPRPTARRRAPPRCRRCRWCGSRRADRVVQARGVGFRVDVVRDVARRRPVGERRRNSSSEASADAGAAARDARVDLLDRGDRLHAGQKAWRRLRAAARRVLARPRSAAGQPSPVPRTPRRSCAAVRSCACARCRCTASSPRAARMSRREERVFARSVVVPIGERRGRAATASPQHAVQSRVHGGATRRDATDESSIATLGELTRRDRRPSATADKKARA